MRLVDSSAAVHANLGSFARTKLPSHLLQNLYNYLNSCLFRHRAATVLAPRKRRRPVQECELDETQREHAKAIGVFTRYLRDGQYPKNARCERVPG